MPISDTQAVAILQSQLAKIDQEYIKPLSDYTYTRDLPIPANGLDRTVDALVMKRLASVGGQGTQSMSGKSWIGKKANDLKGVDIETSAKATRVYTAGRVASWTSLELERAQKYGLRLDSEQIELINEIFQEEANDVAYLGDSDNGITGLLNDASIETVSGTGALSEDTTTTSDMVKLLDNYLRQAEELSGDVLMPSVLLVSPAQYTKLFSMKFADDNKTSLIDYLERQSLAAKVRGSFKVYKVKELAGIGAGSKDRALLYTPETKYLRYNVLPIWREKTYDKGLEYCAAYLWRIAELQIRHPETLMYIDNL